MKITGIISEFNPFHNGHKYLIENAKKTSDAVVCVMSGSFVQRGDVAVFDKWTRARAAVLCGADLVIELPTVFATASAERFASGATELLEKLACVDEIIFGSECGDIEKLISTAKILNNETEEISKNIQNYLASGYGYPTALQKAYDGRIEKELLENPNDILAIEYIKASLKRNSNITFRTIHRAGVNHSDNICINGYASATTVRKKIITNTSYDELIPENVSDMYKNSPVHNLAHLSDTLIYILRKSSAFELAQISDVSEGLENRLKASATSYKDIFTLAEDISTKRYTASRIRRILISVLLGITKEMPFMPIDYIRVLAFNNTGCEVLKKIKASSSTPIITKVADFKEDNEMFKKDILATDISALCSSSNKKNSGKDFTTSPVYVQKMQFPIR